MKTVTRKEQVDKGYVLEPKSKLVPANTDININDNDRGILQSAVGAASEMITHRQMSHFSRTDDNAVSQAQGSLIYSAAYAVAAAMITGGIILFAWLINGGIGSYYAIGFIVVWGICVLGSLAINRGQGLKHSSTGIAHAEIESRERLAMFAIEKHVELIEKRWKLDKE